MKKIIVVAGATGDLGGRIVCALVNRGAEVRAIVRSSADIQKIHRLEILGVKVYRINNWNLEELAKACEPNCCVVSVLAGLGDVIIEAQKVLLDAAVSVGASRFIPSDFSLDFTKFRNGENRNLDLRRDFHKFLESTSIAATSIFNHAFTDLLTHQMPVIFFKQKLVLYWGDANTRWNFTTMDDTAAYTANVALDTSTPRYLSIAGDQISPGEIRAVVTRVTGNRFKLVRTGGQGLLKIIIRIARTFAPAKGELYPAWQGMQYMHNMIDSRSKIHTLDNVRYPGMKWTTVNDVLLTHLETERI